MAPMGRSIMNRTNLALSLTCVAALAGCGGGESESTADGTAEPVLTAATLGPQTVLSVGEYEAMPRYVEANIEYGERLSLQCRACHSLEKDGPHMIGPNLHGFFGRPAGSGSGGLLYGLTRWPPRNPPFAPSGCHQ